MPAPKDPEKIKLWKERMSKARIGMKRSPEFCEQMRQLNLGRVRSEESKQKNSEAHLGKKMPPRTESHRKHLSQALTGIPKSEEHKQKLSIIAKNRSEGHRNKISAAAKERFKNPDFYKQHCDSRRFKHPSEITRLKMSESGIGGFWYGNIRYYDNPYCEKWTAELRERVRAYFGYVCFECGTPQNGRKLNVHHIHYNKKTCCDGSPHDMVPLCPECHTKTNFNRDYWEDHFTELLYAFDPDGKCFFTREEMAALLAT